MAWYFLLLLLFVCFTDFANAKNGSIIVDIVRQKSQFEQYLKNGIHFDEIVRFLAKLNPRTNDSIALYRFLDDQFYGKVVIGHPGQTLNVAFDTAWQLSWVLSSKCSAIKSIGCYFHNKYDHDKSSEYKKDGRPFFMEAGKYNLTGFYSYDNFSVAHSNVTAMSFIEFVSVPYSFIFNKADGVIGLGPKIDDYNPFFYQLYVQKKVKKPLFSIYLNRDTQSKRGGNIMLGFIDDKHIHKNRIGNKTIPETIKYLHVDQVPYWQFTMDKVTIDAPNVVACKNSCKTIVDTSANRILGPKSDIDAIHNVMHAKEFFLNRYTVDCGTVNKLPPINFIIGGQNFTLSGPAYIIKVAYHFVTFCLSAFVPDETTQEQNRWVLGGAFLAEFYSIYNIQDSTIGFVRAAK